MHALEVIIRKNHEAAGREAAEAFNRGDHRTCNTIVAQYSPYHRPDVWRQFIKAYDAERERGPWAEGVARPRTASQGARASGVA